MRADCAENDRSQLSMFCTSLRRRGVGATARGDAPTFSTSAAWPESADFGDEDGDEPGESTRERLADEGPSPEAEAEAEAGACGSFRHDQSSGFSRSEGGPNGLGVRAVGGGVFILPAARWRRLAGRGDEFKTRSENHWRK